MENFGVSTFVASHNRKEDVIQWNSKRWLGCVIEFSFKVKNKKNVKYYRCIRCHELSKIARVNKEKCPVAHLTLENGVIVSDPDNPSAYN